MPKVLAALAALAALACVGFASSAHALNFDFYLSNVVGNVSGTVSGEVFGLTDNSTSAATDVVVTSYPGTLGLGATPIDEFGSAYTVTFNSFTVTAGQVTADAFQSISNLGVYLDFNVSTGYNELDNGGNGELVRNFGGFPGTTFVPFAAPEPVSTATLGSGLLGRGEASSLGLKAGAS